MDTAKAIRTDVFVDEQNVPMDIEMDEFDASSNHILASWNGLPAGTARWRETDEGWKLERFAVLKSYRGKQIGASLVRFIITNIDLSKTVYLYAQESVINFYKPFGFVEEGERFFEANIPHMKMVLNNKNE
ncbi:MAG: GNAT family N-acetyltransferase [Candidatus Marinimicrobia bacterium]|nr:GNAT family N-acetyltransferase [Candidatus Neomarinimicrobiota bacterium]MBT3938045.1 GNAT family N-acetyltransferase [Candidatus Neomarinimicrobiota bacterium]MBT3961543.1 GNAT family N-acetyltransferase [Candidatus Neomarinimicrobiota bacterium]MBT4382069.1 GNAT family N-acetyltransferase [Candidatus Neomarinimicrobiota bacterium]MBT4636076.1 GNAT family N-acetyltransferase [Candidatus Neomarinimicrobiota bacterium]